MAKTTFVDGDPGLGILGTIVNAAFLNKIFTHRHDGVDADGSAPKFEMQVFTSSDTFVVPTGVNRVRVRVWGGGGGGGAVDSSGTGAGSGGGAGGYAEEWVDVTPAASITVTVGSGGAGGTYSPAVSPVAGGTSSFGAYLSATGGGAGTNVTGGGSATGGAGGSGSGGTLNLSGTPGGTSSFHTGTPDHVVAGKGGRSPFMGLGTNASGANGVAPGSGGCGMVMVVTGGGNGGAGAAGMVIVEW